MTQFKRNKHMPQLLIVDDQDGDLINGIKRGYWPEYEKQIAIGNLNVITPRQALALKYPLQTPPLGDGEDFYIGNPSSNTYLSTRSTDLLQDLVIDKSFAVRETLIMMGAKKISLNSVGKEVDTKNTKGDIKANGKAGKIAKAGGEVSVSNTSVNSLDLTTYVESNDPNRVPKKAEEVESFMFEHGLEKDSALRAFLSRLKRDGVMHGTDKYTITYLKEVDNALDIAGSLDIPDFDAGLTFKREHNHTLSITKEVEIDFG